MQPVAATCLCLYPRARNECRSTYARGTCQSVQLPLCPSNARSASPSPVFAPPLQLIPSRKTLTSSYSRNRQTADSLRPPSQRASSRCGFFFVALPAFPSFSILVIHSFTSPRLCSRHRQVSWTAAEHLAIHRLSLLFLARSLARFFAPPSLSAWIVKPAPVFSHFSHITEAHHPEFIASCLPARLAFSADFALAIWPSLAHSHASIDALKAGFYRGSS